MEVTMNTDHIKDLAMSDNGFIFDPATGYSYNSNEIGFTILKLIQHGFTRPEIIKQITEEYDISLDHFNHDYDHYIMMLKSLNLIDELEEA
jgi:hypothetical protein